MAKLSVFFTTCILISFAILSLEALAIPQNQAGWIRYPRLVKRTPWGMNLEYIQPSQGQGELKTKAVELGDEPSDTTTAAITDQEAQSPEQSLTDTKYQKANGCQCSNCQGRKRIQLVRRNANPSKPSQGRFFFGPTFGMDEYYYDDYYYDDFGYEYGMVPPWGFGFGGYGPGPGFGYNYNYGPYF